MRPLVRMKLTKLIELLTIGSTVGAFHPLAIAAVEDSDQRHLSSEVSNALTASLPKFRAKQETAPSDSPHPLGLSAKPKNKIIRLPRVVVEGNRPPIFLEQEIHTAKGLADLAVKRYFNQTGLVLNRFTLPFVGIGKEAYAMLMWQDDERLRLLRKYGEAVQLDRTTGNDARATTLEAIIADTLSRSPQFLSPGHIPYRDARGE